MEFYRDWMVTFPSGRMIHFDNKCIAERNSIKFKGVLYECIIDAKGNETLYCLEGE